MARKKVSPNDDAPSSAPLIVDTVAASPVDAAASPAMANYEPVQINNHNLAELKNTLDDALKRCLSRPDCYSQIHMHTDVRLALGWTGVLVAAATGLYSWKISFEESKQGVLAGVVLYMLLSAAQMTYAYLVEGDTVFVGRRKTLAKRIETERLTTATKTTRPAPGSAAPKTAPSTFSLATFYPRATSTYLPPHYHVTMNYAHTASSGKSLIRSGGVEDERCYADFFDEKGNLDEARFVSWISALVAKVESTEE